MLKIAFWMFIGLVLITTTAICVGTPVEMTGGQFKISFDMPGVVQTNQANGTTYLINGSWASSYEMHCDSTTKSGNITVAYLESATPDEYSLSMTEKNFKPGYKEQAIAVQGYAGFKVSGTVIIDRVEKQKIDFAVIKTSDYAAIVVMGQNDTASFESVVASLTIIRQADQPVVSLAEAGSMPVIMGGEQFTLSFEIPNSTIIESSDKRSTKLFGSLYGSWQSLRCVLKTETGMITFLYFEATTPLDSDAGITAKEFDPGSKNQPYEVNGYSGFIVSGTSTSDSGERLKMDIVEFKTSDKSVVTIIEKNDTAALKAATSLLKIVPTGA